jgi:hypothetical protein
MIATELIVLALAISTMNNARSARTAQAPVALAHVSKQLSFSCPCASRHRGPALRPGRGTGLGRCGVGSSVSLPSAGEGRTRRGIHGAAGRP